MRRVLPRDLAPRRNARRLERAGAEGWRGSQEIQNSYGSEVPGDGGFLIPEELRSDILQVALETAVVRPRATVIPMSSLRVPIPMIDDTSHSSSILGGVVGYWTEEAAGLTESQASFGRVVLDAKKLTAYAEVPNELLMDAPAFEGFFSGTFPKAISWFEDVAFLTGTGTGEPQGYINSPGVRPGRPSNPDSPRPRSCGRTSSRCTRACCRRASAARCGSRASTPSPS